MFNVATDWKDSRNVVAVDRQRATLEEKVMPLTVEWEEREASSALWLHHRAAVRWAPLVEISTGGDGTIWRLLSTSHRFPGADTNDANASSVEY